MEQARRFHWIGKSTLRRVCCNSGELANLRGGTTWVARPWERRCGSHTRVWGPPLSKRSPDWHIRCTGRVTRTLVRNYSANFHWKAFQETPSCVEVGRTFSRLEEYATTDG